MAGVPRGQPTACRVLSSSPHKKAYIATFSKVLFPALRIGYMVVPPALVDRFIDHRRALDLFPPTLCRLAMTDFLRDGHSARHVRRMRTIYQKRRDALVDTLRQRLRDTLTIVKADAGMHLTAWLPPGTDDREIVRRPAARGISTIALSTCYSGKTSRPRLVLGFGGAPDAALRPDSRLRANRRGDRQTPLARGHARTADAACWNQRRQPMPPSGSDGTNLAPIRQK
jgi:DNA-binding transcriptional MocR family regulator